MYGRVSQGRLNEMFGRPIYAGYVYAPEWGISLIQGRHEPLISFALWKGVQDRLNERPDLPIRRDVHPDFPLRGFVLCECCNQPMTAAWSKDAVRAIRTIGA